jgi:hypothetical protein
MKDTQGLKYRGHGKEQFAWRHLYLYLAKEGIQYQRDYLKQLPETVPVTLLHLASPRLADLGLRLTRGEANRSTYRQSVASLVLTKKPRLGLGK